MVSWNFVINILEVLNFNKEIIKSISAYVQGHMNSLMRGKRQCQKAKVVPLSQKQLGRDYQTCQICLNNWCQNSQILHSSKSREDADPFYEVAFQVSKILNPGHCLLGHPSPHLQTQLPKLVNQKNNPIEQLKVPTRTPKVNKITITNIRKLIIMRKSTNKYINLI